MIDFLFFDAASFYVVHLILTPWITCGQGEQQMGRHVHPLVRISIHLCVQQRFETLFLDAVEIL